MRRLFVGQSHDLYWVYNVTCPSVADYFKMVDDSKFHHDLVSQDLTTQSTDPSLTETGGLFRMITRLMTAESPMGTKPNLDSLACLFGRYLQIRDDYMNLLSPDVSK